MKIIWPLQATEDADRAAALGNAILYAEEPLSPLLELALVPKSAATDIVEALQQIWYDNDMNKQLFSIASYLVINIHI
ncbi:hypothetical protein GCM10011396_23400 [Undibacterium terreum]|uniref:Uncharacterized protein n=1 Tax=Undibacterium terreum TaxID=1224302 RepID=A0A916UKL8_9BURK|nr:hypothetical protein GCM10011396_23400 [Undibacterium terreum]